MRFVAGVVALVACVHAGFWMLVQGQTAAPDFDGQFVSISYAPFAGTAHPDGSNRPTVEQIRSDLRTISPLTRAIRTYSSTGGVELVPGIANEFGLKVTVGAWLDKDKNRNERELRSVVELSRRHPNVNGIVVGNEAIYRGELVMFGDETLSAEESRKLAGTDELAKESVRVGRLIKTIQRVKRETNGSVPVTTGEIHSVWLNHPELVSAVDYIAAHILPYWEGIPAAGAVDQAMLIYDKLRQAYPGKRIVIAEFGWPSAGYNRQAAEPGRMEQAAVMRKFVSRADALGIDYNLIEAYDQPWKTFEGSVGAYWGLFDTNRLAKFSWVGPISDPQHWKLAAIAVLAGCLLALLILSAASVTFGQALLMTVAAHGVGAWAAIIFAYWHGHYFVPGAAFALGLGIVLLVPLVLIALARIEEIAEIVFGHAPRRLICAPPLGPDGHAPKVSIHIPAHNEPPDMLKQTLDAVARLAYPNFECIIVINNTPDAALWRPVEEHCLTLGERFKFVYAENLSGYKAGALRLADRHTAADAEIIGVIDADYVVHPDWLKDIVPIFADPKVGAVQAPQDHRDGDRSLMHHAMSGEYSGFFDIGMVQRNEVNAIIVHGTMSLVRRTALDAAGSWSSDTIVEDTDLGLTLLELGWQIHYTNRRYGHGLLPDTFEAYKKQRHRWAYGGFQIIRKHWREFLPWARRLTREQKREFSIGWLNWLGAESIGVVVAVLNLIWVPIVAFVGIAVPDKILTLPIIATFVVAVMHFVVLYRRRVAIPPSQAAGSMVAAMAMQWTVARAVGFGLIKDRLPFVRTAKGGVHRKPHTFAALDEAILGGLLLLGATIVFWTNYEGVREVNLFGYVLIVQSLPFISAVALAALEGSRFNDFAFWRGVEARLPELVTQQPAIADAAAPAENRIEAAQ
jgi:exo-beta-1,3-glucanase (GH17 family)/glycosyltransferase involved in cell wall biosynthesis